MPKRKKDNRLGPNPDPARYILVETKDGSHYRLRRGLNKPAVLNSALKAQAERVKVCSPAARQVHLTLGPYLEGLDVGRITVRLSGSFTKELKVNGKIDFSSLKGFDFQKYHPLDELLRVPYKVKTLEDKVQINIEVGRGKAIVRPSSIIEGYQFSIIILTGNPLTKSLMSTEKASPAYALDEEQQKDCVLEMDLPRSKGPWIVCLKMICLELGEEAVNPKWKAMKVVATGKETN